MMNDYDSHWGQESNHVFAPRLPQDSVQLSRNVVKNCKCECADWVQELAMNLSDAEAGTRKSEKLKEQKTSVFWIKSLFSCLGTYVQQFNSSAENEYMWIEVSEPEFHKVACNERYSFGAYEVDRIWFEGHLSTRDQTLLIRGVGDEIDAYIVPSELWLGLALNTFDEHDFPPFARIKVSGSNGLITTIHITEKEQDPEFFVESSSVPLLARLLFCRLIEASRGLPSANA